VVVVVGGGCVLWLTEAEVRGAEQRAEAAISAAMEYEQVSV
jgi:hypothetical protein